MIELMDLVCLESKDQKLQKFMVLLDPLQLLLLQLFSWYGRWLQSIEIFYYPKKSVAFMCWALTIPIYALVTTVLALGFHIGINFLSIPPPTSFSTIFGNL